MLSLRQRRQEPIHRTLLSILLHARPQLSNCYIAPPNRLVSTRRSYLCAPRAVTQSSLSPVTPNRERAPLVFCLSRTRPRRCSLERVCRICGPVPLTFTRVAPNPCRYFAAVLAGSRSLHPRTYTERVKAAPYNRKPGWVGYASSSFDRCGILVSLASLRSHLLTFVTDLS
jgi:hypothetical protein